MMLQQRRTAAYGNEDAVTDADAQGKQGNPVWGGHVSKHIVKTLFGAAGTALVAIAMVAPAAQAEATDPGYERFAGCPSPSENPTTVTCMRYVFSSGHIQIGKKEIPISNPMTLSGGTEFIFGGSLLNNSQGGLEPVKQPIPGGLIGSTRLDWLSNFLNLNQLRLYAVIELAGEPTVASLQELQLPVKVHLINSVLGDNCYVGSSSNPLTLNLTIGTTNPPAPNKPITGTSPFSTFDPVLEIFSQTDGTFVDNSFAVPGVSGCALSLPHGISLNINNPINKKFGLPAQAGTNEAVVDYSVDLVAREIAYRE